MTSSFSPSDSSLFDSLSDDISLAIDSVGDYHVAFKASLGGGTTSTGASSTRSMMCRPPPGLLRWFRREAIPADGGVGMTPRSTATARIGRTCRFHFSNADDTISPHRPHKIRYASRATGSWVISDIDSTDCSTGDCYELESFDFVLDSADKAHILYGKERGDQYDFDLMYANNVAGSFTSQVLKDVGDGTSGGDGVGDANFELDSSDNLHISFSVGDFSSSSVRHLTDTSGSFVEVTAVSAGNHGSPNAVGVNGDASLKVIAYRDRSDAGSDGSVRAATKEGSAAWQNESVWSNGGDDFGTGSYMDATMNNSGQIMILFHRNSDDTGDDRRVMYAFGTLGSVDSIPPVITLTGSNPQTVECGSAYTELGGNGK